MRRRPSSLQKIAALRKTQEMNQGQSVGRDWGLLLCDDSQFSLAAVRPFEAELFVESLRIKIAGIFMKTVKGVN